jgi:3-carboxy-cis,cis-muconate cycloisomerase
VQEHERGLGNWPAEWDTLPDIVQLTGGALIAMAQVAAGMSFDPGRMRANVELTQGQIFAEAVQMALAPALGRDTAHKLVGEACRQAAGQGRHVRDVLAELPQVRKVLDEAALARVFDPANYLGSSNDYIDRVLGTQR